MAELRRRTTVRVVLRPDDTEDGHHVYMAGLYIGFAYKRPKGIRMSFLPGMVPVDLNYQDYSDIDAMLETLTMSLEDEE